MFVNPIIRRSFFIIKPTRCINFTNFFLAWNSTCFGQFLCPSSGVYSLYTQHWYMSYRFLDSFRVGPAVYCTVYSEYTLDDGQKNCPKHVEFHAINKFVKLVNLVGFVIKKFVTMSDHMNLKKKGEVCLVTTLLQLAAHHNHFLPCTV